MSAGPAAAHRQPTRRSPAPRAPRRVSGPVRAPERLRANGGAAALPRPVGRPAPPLAPRALDALLRLPDHRFLDRLLRGRGWIALVAVALGGIVALQVSLLKLNAGIGRAVEHAGTLERQNADLRASVSQLSAEERIQREAVAMGLHMPSAGEVRYVTARGAEDARKAARVMRAPNPPQPRPPAEGQAVGGVAAPAAEAPATVPAAAPQQPVQPHAHEHPDQSLTPAAQTQAAATGAAAGPAPAAGGTP